MYTGSRALGQKKGKDGLLEVEVEDKKGKKKTLKGEKILVAIGRVPNSENLGLEKLKIETERGYIKVGDYYRTSVLSVFCDRRRECESVVGACGEQGRRDCR